MWEGPYGKGGAKKYLGSSIDQSLRRMGIEYAKKMFLQFFQIITSLNTI